MYIQDIGHIPIGKYQYNGYNWIVSANSILKSIPFYPDSYRVVNTDDIIMRLELAGLLRTITV